MIQTTMQHSPADGETAITHNEVTAACLPVAPPPLTAGRGTWPAFPGSEGATPEGTFKGCAVV